MWGEMPSKFQSLSSWYYTPAYVMAFDMGTENLLSGNFKRRFLVKWIL